MLGVKVGIFIVPFFYSIVAQPKVELNASPLMMIVAGLLVGFGTRLGVGVVEVLGDGDISPGLHLGDVGLQIGLRVAGLGVQLRLS